MKRQILIDRMDERVWTFTVEDGEITEIHCSDVEDVDNPCRLGDIFIGKVQNIVEQIGAAFVEVRRGSVCYMDLKDAQYAVFTRKQGKKPLCIGDELVVQVSREAVKTKAPTVTARISLTGKYSVLTHGNTGLGVSAKIPKERKDDYRSLLKERENASYGLIIRTNAKDVPISEVTGEIDSLTAEYRELVERAATRVCFSRLKTALPAYLTDLKNVYLDGLEEILVGDKELFGEISAWFSNEFPDRMGLLRLYEDSSYPLSKLYGTEKVIEKALQEKVWLRHGGYLVIQPTEALTVVDVNSGKDGLRGKDEVAILKINLEAAKETAKQLRLRNISGIVIIDFINMENEENRECLLREFRRLLSADSVSTNLVGITRLGLVEVTRKKVRKPLAELMKRGYN